MWSPATLSYIIYNCHPFCVAPQVTPKPSALEKNLGLLAALSADLRLNQWWPKSCPVTFPWRIHGTGIFMAGQPTPTLRGRIDRFWGPSLCKIFDSKKTSVGVIYVAKLPPAGATKKSFTWYSTISMGLKNTHWLLRRCRKYRVSTIWDMKNGKKLPCNRRGDSLLSTCDSQNVNW